ncbi:MAG TPA: hypothetical protein VHY08_03270 [Bacillota bacterium]|nr:hypothetical protein [Bacillota bacterium]
MMNISIRGAAENNLQHIDVDFTDGLTVVTGVSGSGKSSLVFDTLYHEVKRRFSDVFEAGAHDIHLAPAKVKSITGAGPVIAIGQNLLNRNPRSTLATASGLHPFLRLLFARFGARACPACGAAIQMMSEDEIVKTIHTRSSLDSPVTIYAPILNGVKGSHRRLLEYLFHEYEPNNIFINHQPLIGASNHIDPEKPTHIWLKILDCVDTTPSSEILKAIQEAATLGVSSIKISPALETRACARIMQFETLSWANRCPFCNLWIHPLKSSHFNTPCGYCHGAGCPECNMTGIYPEAASTEWNGLKFYELLSYTVDEVERLFRDNHLPEFAARLETEIMARVKALINVGLGYLGLNRPVPTLSRGEAQRLRLAIALTNKLEDILYILDEPTIGQHPSNIINLVNNFRLLKGPVIYVEHDRIAAAEADWVVDIGPGAGGQGGKVIFTGTPAELWQAPTPTGRFFSQYNQPQEFLPAPPEPVEFLIFKAVKSRNLKGINIRIPLRSITVISGVSGSGKSTLVEEVVVPTLLQKKPVACEFFEGEILKPVFINQDPIGINPRSNPATYTNLADYIRDSFSLATGLPPAHFSFNRPEGACPKCKGMGAQEVHLRFLPSYWVICEECGGKRFSAEVLAKYADFGERMLSIADFYELSIAEAEEFFERESRLPKNKHGEAILIFAALREVGLGYLKLGQPSPTLSGGEAQRVKLSKYLGQKMNSSLLLVLDEPSSGLHPQDVSGLIQVFRRLARRGATLMIVEHNPDIIQAADWCIDLGPGAGDQGGEVIYQGMPQGLMAVKESATGAALHMESRLQPNASPRSLENQASGSMIIKNAWANNLKHIDLVIPKNKLIVITGLSGSGKSSLVHDVLEAEAYRRYLESLSMYERQGAKEDSESAVESILGLGVTFSLISSRMLFNIRKDVGFSTGLSHHLAVLFAQNGERYCLKCNQPMLYQTKWFCTLCGETFRDLVPEDFFSTRYTSACPTCHGIGTQQVPAPEKLISHPEKPLCAGALRVPRFLIDYYIKPKNSGYYIMQALAQKYEFDPLRTPWNQMTHEAQSAFLYGDPEPLQVAFQSKYETRKREREGAKSATQDFIFNGFYSWKDQDVKGVWTNTQICPACKGDRLKKDLAVITLFGYTLQELSRMSFKELAAVLGQQSLPAYSLPATGLSYELLRRRLSFLNRIGLSYINLQRIVGTLSVGEAQRIRLSSLLGSELTALTVLLDEPTRGLHPSEVTAFVDVLKEIRGFGNTVIVVEHDLEVIKNADQVIEMGPGAGNQGGSVIFQGAIAELLKTDSPTARINRFHQKPYPLSPVKKPTGYLTIQGARACNLKNINVHIPLGILTGICGVSGSGKSVLMIDTLGRALTKTDLSFAVKEPVEPGEHDAILGAPERVLIVDQILSGFINPFKYFDIDQIIYSLYAASEDAIALGLGIESFARGCGSCDGTGYINMEMDFLPDVKNGCEICNGTGLSQEVESVRLKGLTISDLLRLTVDEVADIWGDQPRLKLICELLRKLHLGYLVLSQPGYSLSGGESQRLKIAKELLKKQAKGTLYLLDEPTVGLHEQDVQTLIKVFGEIVKKENSLVVIEHNPLLLAACDWLIELGPGGGPEGGAIIAEGPPEEIAKGTTPISGSIRNILEGRA